MTNLQPGEVYNWVRDALGEGDFDTESRDAERKIAEIITISKSNELIDGILDGVDFDTARAKLAANRQLGLDDLNNGIAMHGPIILHLANGQTEQLSGLDWSDQRLIVLSEGNSYELSELASVSFPDETSDDQ